MNSEPLLALLKRSVADVVKLVTLEATLAGIELKKKAIALAIGIALLIVVALLGVAILATLTATLVLAFALVVAPWLAALIVTGIFVLLALVLALIARAQIASAIPPVPAQTIATVKENMAWAKRLLASNDK